MSEQGAHPTTNPPAACKNTNVNVDEVFGVSNRQYKYRPASLFVTDITASEWCQVQTAFNLHVPELKVQTEVMKQGSARHLELQKEVQTRVEVEMLTAEDAFATRLLNTVYGLHSLVTAGITRELPVQGKAHGVWISGIIDQLALSWSSADQRMMVSISEHKTRHRPTMPPCAQTRNSRLQVMIYKSLLDNLKSITEPETSQELYALFNLNPKLQLSLQIQQLALMQLAQQVSCIDDAMVALQEILSQLPPTSSDLSIVYEHQHTKQQIGTDAFKYEAAWMEQTLQQQLGFWRGASAPERVLEEEQWKCKSCQHQKICSNVGAELLDPDFDW